MKKSVVKAQKVKQNKTESKAMSQSKDKSAAQTKALSKTKKQSASKTKQPSSAKAKSRHIASSASSSLAEHKQSNSTSQSIPAVLSELQTKTSTAATDTATLASTKVATQKPTVKNKKGTKAASAASAKSKACVSTKASAANKAHRSIVTASKTSAALKATLTTEISADTDSSTALKSVVNTKSATNVASQSSVASANKPTPKRAKTSTSSRVKKNISSTTDQVTAKVSLSNTTSSNKQAAVNSSKQVATIDSNQDALTKNAPQHSNGFLMPYSAVDFNDSPTTSVDFSESAYKMTEAMAALDNAWKHSAPYSISEYQLSTEQLTHSATDAAILNTKENVQDGFKTTAHLAQSKKDLQPDSTLVSAPNLAASLQSTLGSTNLSVADEQAMSEIKLFSHVDPPESGITHQTNLQSSKLMQNHMQHYNAYSQQLVLLSQRSNLNQFSTEEQSTLINEYFSIFNNALNVIMLNSNERSIVEQALEEIMNYAAPIFEAEYKTFFYMCFSAAPRTLFWMLQYPFYSNFFMSKNKSLSASLSNKDKSSDPDAIDEKIMREVNSTLDTYQHLRQRFADLSAPMLSLHDNIMLSLYEEQNMLRQHILKQPKLTQRGRIRAIVKSGGKMPDDQIKMRLKQVNRQLFALHNLRLSEIRQMGMTLEKLAHSPKRLSDIFGTDFKHFYMPQQLILQKLNSWTTMFPFSQQCLLVQLDDGFVVRSPRMPEVLYTQSSFKKQSLIILDGLEVCYSPELCTAIDHQLNALNRTKVSTKQASLKSQSGARAKLEAVPAFDPQEIDSSFKALSLKLKSLQDTPEWQNQSNNLAWKDPEFEDDSSSTLWEQDNNISPSSLDKLLLKTTTTQLLHPSDFQLEHCTDDSADEPMDDAEFFSIDADQERTASKDTSSRHKASCKHKQLSYAANAEYGIAKGSGSAQQNGSSPASYISGVFFGSQGAAYLSQLQRFNERNLLVDGRKTGFMVVTL